MEKAQWDKVVADMAKMLTLKQVESWRKGSDQNKREMKKTMKDQLPGNLLHLLRTGGRAPAYKIEGVGDSITFVYGDIRCTQ